MRRETAVRPISPERRNDGKVIGERQELIVAIQIPWAVDKSVFCQSLS
jgi:hypothetical protein